MTRAQREAHLRMISTLGVRNHEGVYGDRGDGVALDKITPDVIQQVHLLINRNTPDRTIRRRLKLGPATLQRIKEAIRRG